MQAVCPFATIFLLMISSTSDSHDNMKSSPVFGDT